MISGLPSFRLAGILADRLLDGRCFVALRSSSVLGFVLLLVAAACGDSDDSTQGAQVGGGGGAAGQGGQGGSAATGGGAGAAGISGSGGTAGHAGSSGTGAVAGSGASGGTAGSSGQAGSAGDAGAIGSDPRFVSTTGSDSNDGLTEAQAWRTITYAAIKAAAGNTVNIKGGDYGAEHVVVANSGTSDKPIVFRGYDGMPLIDGADGTGKGIDISSKDYVQVSNLEVKRYQHGVYMHLVHHAALDGLKVSDLGSDVGGQGPDGTYYDGWGIVLSNVTDSVVSNCSVTDGRAENYRIEDSENNLIDHCTSDSIATANPTDYHFGTVGESKNNTIQDCTARNQHPTVNVHPGHGFGFKTAPSFNKVVNCTGIGLAEYFFAAQGSHDNEFTGCTADNGGFTLSIDEWDGAFVVRQASYNNSFTGCKAIGVKKGVSFYEDYAETGWNHNGNPHNNTVKNSIFSNVTRHGIVLYNADNSTFANNVFVGRGKAVAADWGQSPGPLGYLDNNFFVGINQTGTQLTNNIVTEFVSSGSGADALWWATHVVTPHTYTPNQDYAGSYNDFYSSGFVAPTATGNISVDPLFADWTHGDFHLQSAYGRWNGSSWVNDAATSPCIDGGDPSAAFSNEPLPNGGRINIGAYGNTAEASKSAN
jgi:parallel beta-helix repeat protein